MFDITTYSHEVQLTQLTLISTINTAYSFKEVLLSKQIK